jgi:hypothetical protein
VERIRPAGIAKLTLEQVRERTELTLVLHLDPLDPLGEVLTKAAVDAAVHPRELSPSGVAARLRELADAIEAPAVVKALERMNAVQERWGVVGTDRYVHEVMCPHVYPPPPENTRGCRCSPGRAAVRTVDVVKL